MKANIRNIGQISRQKISQTLQPKKQKYSETRISGSVESKIEKLKSARSERARLSWVIRRLKG